MAKKRTAKETLRSALLSAAWLIERDHDLKDEDTLDCLEHDVGCAMRALEALLDERALAEDENP